MQAAPGGFTCDRGGVDRRTARSALEVAVREREEARTADEVARDHLHEAIRDAHRAGLSHVEIGQMTGLHRNSVGRIVGDTPRD